MCLSLKGLPIKRPDRQKEFDVSVTTASYHLRPVNQKNLMCLYLRILAFKTCQSKELDVSDITAPYQTIRQKN